VNVYNIYKPVWHSEGTRKNQLGQEVEWFSPEMRVAARVQAPTYAKAMQLAKRLGHSAPILQITDSKAH
jgi:hypothetical protein